MFYYLGRKKRLAGLYPEPTEDTIIEPFAGSAAYSLHGSRWERQVVLNDLSHVTMLVWRYLQQATDADIAALPSPLPGERISRHTQLTDAERWLIAFHVNPGANQRTDVVTQFNRWPAGKKYIQRSLHKVKHWQLVEGDYLALDNRRATWFIDPPYTVGGKHYMTNTLQDYAGLARWCRSRAGQRIVCEQTGATWLPFSSLKEIACCGQVRSSEAVCLDASLTGAQATTKG